jgi:hypothetical protein
LADSITEDGRRFLTQVAQALSRCGFGDCRYIVGVAAAYKTAQAE